MKLLVKNGMIATESQVFQGDILIEDEKIKSIGTVLEEEDAEVIDATGRYVIPGGVRSEERRVGKECRSRWSPYH